MVGFFLNQIRVQKKNEYVSWRKITCTHICLVVFYLSSHSTILPQSLHFNPFLLFTPSSTTYNSVYKFFLLSFHTSFISFHSIIFYFFFHLPLFYISFIVIVDLIFLCTNIFGNIQNKNGFLFFKSFTQFDSNCTSLQTKPYYNNIEKHLE